MMTNELIPTNGLWYRIKKFFRGLFFKEKTYPISEINTIEKKTKINTDNLRERFEEQNKKNALAEKLLYGEIGTSDLNETEVDEMIEHFKKDNQNIDNELLRIKQHILYMQKELKN